MRIIFMGTPDLAAVVLQDLYDSGNEISLVVTQPDRQRGRGKKVSVSPVKALALEHDIPVFQPERVRRPEAVERLRQENADLIVVAAFGQILPKEILEMPRLGCINVHASLLPAYRGAAPIQWAVLNGEKKSGVTIMRMDEGLDTGDILLQKEVELDPKETADSLYDKLAKLGGKLLVQALPGIEDGSLSGIHQDDEKSSYAHMLTRQMGEINWSESAQKIERLVRGLNSWPSAYTSLRGKQLKIWEADVLAEESDAAPGTVVRVEKRRICVATGEGVLALGEVQLSGKKRMSVQAFLLGTPVKEGERLGEES